MITKPHFPLEEYQQRRQSVFDAMPENSVLLVAAGNEVTRSQDTDYKFCQNKYFWYLTGFPEPDAVLMLCKRDQNVAHLFCRPKDKAQEVWHGLRIGPDLAASGFGFEKTSVIGELADVLESSLTGASALLKLENDNAKLDELINTALKAIRAKRKIGKQAPTTFTDATPILDDLRLIKSPAELALMRQANLISGDAHVRAMKLSKQDVMEYQLEADILHQFRFNGAQAEAYGTIVGSGSNATILHYTDNDQPLKNGDLVLIDAGAELLGYAADITRTFPVNGKFSDAQAAIYDLVLTAQIEAIKAIRPGQTFAKLNEIVLQVLTEGLVALNILQGDLTQLIKEKAAKQYFIHGLGHWLGLDVHDVGDYQVDDERRQNRLFESGMVMTIEPGLYFAPDDESVDETWRGIGVRIEDNIVVTDAGCENLTVNVPKTRDEIEALMTAK